MIGLDTNILMRFVTRDDEEQCKIVKDFIMGNKGKANSMYINDVVLCELCWILNTSYKYSNQQIYSTICLLLDIEEFGFADRAAILEAVILYNDKAGDFADYLIYALNKRAGCGYTCSFDKKMVNKGMFRSIS